MLENEPERVGDAIQVEQENQSGRTDVQEYHHGYEDTGESPYRPDTTQDHGGHEKRGRQADRQSGKPGDVAYGLRDGVGLDPVPDSKGRQRRKQGEADRQYPSQASPPDPVLQVVHGSAGLLAPGVRLPEANAQHGLRVLGGHADQAGDPHPEERPGPTGGDRGCDTHDVTGSDGRGEGGHQGLEVRDIAFGSLFTGLEEGEIEGMPQLAELQAPEEQG